MSTDLSLTSDQQLLALINGDNAATLNETHVQFNAPQVLIDDPDNKNTGLEVVSRPNGGYSGSVNIKYDRLNLNGFEVYGSPTIIMEEDNGIVGVVEAFNLLYGGSLEVGEDIDSGLVIETLDYTPRQFVLPAMEGSLAYFGSIELTISLATTSLPSVIANTTFGGLEFSPPEFRLNGGYTEIFNLSAIAARDGVAFIEGNYFYHFGGDIGGSTHHRRAVVVNLTNNAINDYTSSNDNISVPERGGLRISDNKVVTARNYNINGTVSCFFREWTFDGSTEPTFTLYQCTFANQNIPYNDVICIVAVGNKYIIADDCGYVFEVDTTTLTTTFLNRVIGGTARSGRACHRNGKIYFYGFRDATEGITVFVEYDIMTNTYQQLTGGSIGVWSPAMIAHAGYIYSIGGSNANGAQQSYLQEYSIAENSWRVISTDELPPRARGIAFNHEGNVHLFGGGHYLNATDYGTLLRLT